MDPLLSSRAPMTTTAKRIKFIPMAKRKAIGPLPILIKLVSLSLRKSRSQTYVPHEFSSPGRKNETDSSCRNFPLKDTDGHLISSQFLTAQQLV